MLFIVGSRVDGRWSVLRLHQRAVHTCNQEAADWYEMDWHRGRGRNNTWNPTFIVRLLSRLPVWMIFSRSAFFFSAVSLVLTLPAVVCPSLARQGVRCCLHKSFYLSAGLMERYRDDSVWQCDHGWSEKASRLRWSPEIGEEMGADSPSNCPPVFFPCYLCRSASPRNTHATYAQRSL